MTTICLNKEAAKHNGVTIDEVLLMLVINSKANLERAQKLLIEKGYITAASGNPEQTGWRLTNVGTTILNYVIIDSSKEQEPEERLTNLAKRLKEIFPKGKKDGTNYYWAEGIALIIRRLQLFFRKYGNKFTDDQIIQAAEKYVQGFNGNYQYMRLLKYFIFKEKVGAGGEVEGDSELISYIENADQEDELKNDWETTLR